MSKPRRRRRKMQRLPVRSVGARDREAFSQSSATGPSTKLGRPGLWLFYKGRVFANMCRRSVPMLRPNGRGPFYDKQRGEDWRMNREMRLTVGGVMAGVMWVLAVSGVSFDAIVGDFIVGRIGLLLAAMAAASTVRCSLACQANRTRALMRALAREQEERGLRRLPTL